MADRALAQLVANCIRDAAGSAHGHRGFVDNHFEAGHIAADIARRSQYVLQIRRAVFVGRRTHRNKLHIAMRHAGRDISRKLQPAGSTIALDDFLQTRFVYRHATGIQDGDFTRVDVQAKHVVTDLGQACTGYQSDVTCPDDGDFHMYSAKNRNKILKALNAIPRAALTQGVLKRRR